MKKEIKEQLEHVKNYLNAAETLSLSKSDLPRQVQFLGEAIKLTIMYLEGLRGIAKKQTEVMDALLDRIEQLGVRMDVLRARIEVLEKS